jgi:hypothetical protein
VHRDTRALAHKFVMRRLSSVLKAPPAAEIVDKDCFVRLFSTDNIVHQSGQTVPALQRQATLPGIFVSLDKCEAVNFSIF